MRRVGDKLVADFNDVPSEIVDAISEKRYNGVSVEIWPQVEFQGKTFKNVLGAVALLGAEWPAVKGLKPLSASLFSNSDPNKVVLTQKEEAMVTQEQHDAALATLKAEIAAATRASTIATTALASFRDDQANASIDAFIADVEKRGVLLPKHKDTVKAFAMALKTVKVTLSGKDHNAIDVLTSLFADVTPKVDLSERGKGKEDAPVGDTASVQIAELASAKQKADPKLNFEQAVQAVFAEKPELKSQYAEERS
jgi:hypothetical protein